MRRLYVAIFLLVLAGAGAVGSAAPEAVGSPAPRSCVGSVLHFGERGYRPVVLAQRRGKLGLRLRRPLALTRASLADHSNCIDVVVCELDQPCGPPQQPPPLSSRRVTVARLAGIRPSLALGDRDDPRIVYVFGACLERGNGKRLVRCLRSQSR